MRSQTHQALTFSNQVLDVLVEPEAVAFAPQTHVGGVILAAALVSGAHGEKLPSVARHEQLAFPAVESRAASAQRQAVVGDVDETRVLAAAREASAPLSIAPGIRLVPVVGAHGHGQHT